MSVSVRLSLFVLLAAPLLLASVSQSHGATRTWQGLQSDFWDVDANWVGGVGPSSEDNVIVTEGTPLIRTPERIQNITNAGDITVESSFEIAGSTSLNFGSIEVGGFTSVIPRLLFSNSPTLQGSGEIALRAGIIQAVSDAGSTEPQITQNAGHSITGQGAIDIDLLNRGAIEGDSASEPIRVWGRLSGDGPLENVVVEADGVHAPGDDGSNAVVSLAGDYTIGVTGGLEIDLAGTTPGAGHDQLNSTGTITLGGTLEVKLSEGFAPQLNDAFTIIDSSGGSIAGAFDDVVLPAATSNLAIEWDLEQSPTAVTLRVLSVRELPGDYNADGVVDAADYTVWRDTHGEIGLARFSGADGDGDGEITSADYDVWAANFGATVGAPMAAAVPEPSAVFLVGGAVIAMAGRRRR